MNRVLLLLAAAAPVLWSQKIETLSIDQSRIIQVETALNHLSVIELGEPVLEVAAGSPAFKIEWRENKVFVQPLESEARTNLFIWTAAGRLSYELLPAGSVDRMHFAIDHEPRPEAIQSAATQPAKPGYEPPIGVKLLLEGKPVRAFGKNRTRGVVGVQVTDVCRNGERVYVRYAIHNQGRSSYTPGGPDIQLLRAPRSTTSLVSLRNSQVLDDGARIKSNGVTPVPVIQAEGVDRGVPPGGTDVGVVAFELPAARNPGIPQVVKLCFKPAASREISALVVL